MRPNIDASGVGVDRAHALEGTSFAMGRSGTMASAQLAHGGLLFRTNETACDYARSPEVNSVLIGVKATSVGHMRDREPGCKAGRKAPVNGRVSTRDRAALLYSMAVWRYGPVSAVGTAREGMGCCKRRPTALYL